MKMHEELEHLRGMSSDELKTKQIRLKESLFRLKFKLALSEMDTVKNIRREKKEFARVSTILREREMGTGKQQ
ncbi:MAG: 50S ribosomal protein L29 [Pyrinomonadaceae bacterium]